MFDYRSTTFLYPPFCISSFLLLGFSDQVLTPYTKFSKIYWRLGKEVPVCREIISSNLNFFCMYLWSYLWKCLKVELVGKTSFCRQVVNLRVLSIMRKFPDISVQT